MKKVLAETAATLQQEQTPKNKGNGTQVLMVTKEGSHYLLESLSWQALSQGEQVTMLRQLFSQNNLPLPTKSLTETLLADMARSQKKGLAKEYSRLSLRVNNGMIDIHFKELD